MKTLELTEMENLLGGSCSSTANKVIATAGAVATVAGFFGPIGAIIAAPTAVGMGVASLYCAYS